MRRYCAVCVVGCLLGLLGCGPSKQSGTIPQTNHRCDDEVPDAIVPGGWEGWTEQKLLECIGKEPLGSQTLAINHLVRTMTVRQFGLAHLSLIPIRWDGGIVIEEPGKVALVDGVRMPYGPPRPKGNQTSSIEDIERIETYLGATIARAIGRRLEITSGYRDYTTDLKGNTKDTSHQVGAIDVRVADDQSALAEAQHASKELGSGVLVIAEFPDKKTGIQTDYHFVNGKLKGTRLHKNSASGKHLHVQPQHAFRAPIQNSKQVPLADGAVYDGDTVSTPSGRAPLGRGTVTHKDGTKVVGIFANGRNVDGTILTVSLPDGTTTSGIQQDGKLEGWVDIKNRDGSTFNGTFKNGKPVKGTFTHGPAVYNGELSQNFEMSGQGSLSVSGRFVYVGSFKDGKMDGSGEVKFTDGTGYKGEFQNNKPHGKGEYNDRSGNSKGGRAEHGSFYEAREARGGNGGGGNGGGGNGGNGGGGNGGGRIELPDMHIEGRVR